MLGHQRRYRITEGTVLDALGKPGSCDGIIDERSFFRGDWPAIEIGRRPAVECRAIFCQVNELQPLRDDARLTRANRAPVADRVLQVDQQTLSSLSSTSTLPCCR